MIEESIDNQNYIGIRQLGDSGCQIYLDDKSYISLNKAALAADDGSGTQLLRDCIRNGWTSTLQEALNFGNPRPVLLHRVLSNIVQRKHFTKDVIEVNRGLTVDVKGVVDYQFSKVRINEIYLKVDRAVEDVVVFLDTEEATFVIDKDGNLHDENTDLSTLDLINLPENRLRTIELNKDIDLQNFKLRFSDSLDVEYVLADLDNKCSSCGASNVYNDDVFEISGGAGISISLSLFCDSNKIKKLLMHYLYSAAAVRAAICMIEEVLNSGRQNFFTFNSKEDLIVLADKLNEEYANLLSTTVPNLKGIVSPIDSNCFYSRINTHQSTIYG